MMNDTEASAVAPAPKPARIAGFWRRLAAALVDALVLGIVGFAIGTLFTDQLVALGPYGRAVGFPIALLYFGLLNGNAGGGATLGKRMLGIRVVGRDGASVSVLRSLWRAAVYLVPFYLNGLDLSFLPLNDAQTMAALVVDAVLVFGVIGATVYLYLFNFRTRQMMHDLAAGTFVVRADSAAPPINVRINRAHLAVVALWLLLILGTIPLGLQYAVPYLKNWFDTTFATDIGSLGTIQAAVDADPKVLSSGVEVSTTTLSMTGQPTTTTTYLTVTTILRQMPADPESAADSIAARVLSVAPDAGGRQQLRVFLRCGYDIGIWSSWSSYSYSHTPREWRARLHPAKAI